ncbi:fimbrial protein [Serratia fonticola]
MMSVVRVVSAVHGRSFGCFVLTGVLLLSSALAHSASTTTTVTVKVTVFAPLPCRLNDGNVVEVDFGNDMLTKNVDGKNYSQPIPFNLVCSGASNNAMKFRIQGTKASFGGTNILMTSNTNLGIAIQIKGFGLTVPINSDVKFTYPKTLPLEAVPVKRPGSTLRSGKFTAGAILTVDYQ